MMGGKMMRGKMFRPQGDDDSNDDEDKHLFDDSSSDSSDDDDDSDDDEEETEKKAPVKTAPAATSGGESAPAKDSANLSSEDDDDEDDDDDDDDDEDDAEEDGDAKKASKRSRGDSDDDESAEDEEDAKTSSKNSKKENGGKGKKKKRSKISFFDEEAEASDDDDEDDDLPYGTHKDPDDVVRKHYTEEDIRKEYRDEEAEAIIAQQDRRRQRAGGWLGGLGGLDGREDDDYSNAARIARELEERHRMERRIVHRERLDVGRRGGVGGRDDRGIGRDDEEDDEIVDAPAFTAVAQQSLVPSVSDPNLWMFNCPTGKEQDLVFQIMNKCVAHAKRGRPLGITSVVAAQTKGKIYVESYSEPAVVEAVQGVRGLMQYSMRLVPLSDMTTVMTVVPKKVPGESESFVVQAVTPQSSHPISSPNQPYNSEEE